MIHERYRYDKTLFVWDVINRLIENKKRHKETDRIFMAQSIYDSLLKPFSSKSELMDFIKRQSGYKHIEIVITD